MNLGQPKHVEAPAFGRFDLLKALLEGLGVALAFDLTVKFVVPAEFKSHGILSSAAPHPATAAAI
jgi:hypothetical protein